MTRFSIIIPFHNDAGTIQETLDSIRAQSFTNWEAYCIGDRPSRASCIEVLEYAERDPRIHVALSPVKGPAGARNHGAKMAQGELLAFCDADDLWHPDKLMQLHHLFQTSGVHAAFGQIRFFAQNPGDCAARSTVPRQPLSIADLLCENPVCTMSNLTIQRSIFSALGGLDQTAVHNEDLEFLIRLVGEGYILQGIDQFQTWYRSNTSGLSADLKAMRAGRAQALRRAAEYGVVTSPKSEAVYLRYLARRALRLNQNPAQAWPYVRSGLALHARSFLLPLRRGVPTALGAALAPVLPQTLRRALFS